MSAAKRVAGLALAGIIGVGLAVALFPSPPEAPEPVVAQPRPKKAAASRAVASAPPRSERPEPQSRAGASRAERPDRGGGGEGADRPPPPQGKAGDPIQRHLLVDADGWLRVSEALAKAGMKAEGDQAAQMARRMRDASNKPRDQLSDLFIEESAIAEKIPAELVGLEAGLTAAQQGGVHPSDLPPKKPGSPQGAGNGPDTGLE